MCFRSDVKNVPGCDHWAYFRRIRTSNVKVMYDHKIRTGLSLFELVLSILCVAMGTKMHVVNTIRAQNILSHIPRTLHKLCDFV